MGCSFFCFCFLLENCMSSLCKKYSMVSLGFSMEHQGLSIGHHRFSMEHHRCDPVHHGTPWGFHRAPWKSWKIHSESMENTEKPHGNVFGCFPDPLFHRSTDRAIHSCPHGLYHCSKIYCSHTVLNINGGIIHQQLLKNIFKKDL